MSVELNRNLTPRKVIERTSELLGDQVLRGDLIRSIPTEKQIDDMRERIKHGNKKD